MSLLSGYVNDSSLSSKWRCSWSNTVGVGAENTFSRRTRWYWFRKGHSGAASAMVVQEAQGRLRFGA